MLSENDDISGETMGRTVHHPVNKEKEEQKILDTDSYLDLSLSDSKSLVQAAMDPAWSNTLGNITESRGASTPAEVDIMEIMDDSDDEKPFTHGTVISHSSQDLSNTSSQSASLTRLSATRMTGRIPPGWYWDETSNSLLPDPQVFQSLKMPWMSVSQVQALSSMPLAAQQAQKYFLQHLSALQSRAPQLKVHICSVCNKQFSRRGNLMQHMAVHKATKDYHCPICERRFSFIQACKFHVRHVHNKDLSQFRPSQFR